MNVLQIIRGKLKVPKTEYNEFGDFYFRNKANILEKAKPLLEETDSYLQFKNRLVSIGGKLFVESTVYLMKDGDEKVFKATGYALHANELPKMQPAMVTGTTVSYAEKAALEDLFLLDGGDKDPDAMKPNIAVPKSKQSIGAGSPGKKLPWLNAGTKDYTETLAALKANTTTLVKVKESFQISKATETRIQAELK